MEAESECPLRRPRASSVTPSTAAPASCSARHTAACLTRRLSLSRARVSPHVGEQRAQRPCVPVTTRHSAVSPAVVVQPRRARRRSNAARRSAFPPIILRRFCAVNLFLPHHRVKVIPVCRVTQRLVHLQSLVFSLGPPLLGGGTASANNYTAYLTKAAPHQGAHQWGVLPRYLLESARTSPLGLFSSPKDVEICTYVYGILVPARTTRTTEIRVIHRVCLQPWTIDMVMR